MITIHKYELIPDPRGRCDVGAPEGSVFLSTHVQGIGVFVWMLVDAARPIRVYSYWVYGTGREIPFDIAARPFRGTVHMPKEGLVFHVFGGTSA